MGDEPMGCGQKAAAEREEHEAFEERLKHLRVVTPETWDTFLDDVSRLLDSIERSNIMEIARGAVVVQDGLKYIRRIREARK
jgi:hypothetical protein